MRPPGDAARRAAGREPVVLRRVDIYGIERLPKDPWSNPYQFLNPGVHGEIDVFSYGADGAPGGEGNDADIGSWEL